MIKIDESYNSTGNFPALLTPYFQGLSFGVLDIETTGLSPGSSQFILGGLLTPEESYICEESGFPLGQGFMAQQFFAESRAEEEFALGRYIEEISKLDVVVTYNGKRFDMPFIKERAVRLGLEPFYREPWNFDLYLMLNKYSSLRKVLPNLKQKTVENYFGLWEKRTDEISGAESVELYNRWERRGEREILEKILLHNRDDVIQLFELLPIIKKADVHKGMFDMGFPVKNLSVTSICVRNSCLQIEGIQRHSRVSYYSYSTDKSPWSAVFDGLSGSFEAEIPLRNVSISEESTMLLIDLEKILPDCGELSGYPSCGSGWLAISRGEEYNYQEINHFIRLFLKRVLEDCI